MPPRKVKSKKVVDRVLVSDPHHPPQEAPSVPAVIKSPPRPPPALILTSEKRRGVYECDCCHVDVSQAPRIQCSVCVDFDICLDCFVKADSTHQCPRHKSMQHGYRVADSTRFPLFPSFRSVVPNNNRSSAGTTSSQFKRSSSSSLAINEKPPIQPMGSASDILHTRRDDQYSATMDSSTSTVVACPAEQSQEGNNNTPCETQQETLPVTALLSTSSIPDETSLILDPSLNATSSTQNVETNTRVETCQMDFDLSTSSLNMSTTTESTIPFKDPMTPFSATLVNGTNKAGGSAATATATTASSSAWSHTEDPKNIWTVEEDLRLLDAIQSFGVGNWDEVNEAVSNGTVLPILTHDALSSTSLHPVGNSCSSIGSSKTAKKCMERYFDDYLGRYGHIVPPFLFEQVQQMDEEKKETNFIIHPSETLLSGSKDTIDMTSTNSLVDVTRANVGSSDTTTMNSKLDKHIIMNTTTTEPKMETTLSKVVRSSSTLSSSISTRKRKFIENVPSDSSDVDPIKASSHIVTSSNRSSRSNSEAPSSKRAKTVKTIESDLVVSPSPSRKSIVGSIPIQVPKKKYRIIPSSSTPEYDSFWPSKYVPSIPGIEIGDEVGRDIASRAEQTFVKLISSCSTKEEGDVIRKEWEETRLNKPNGPRVLPFRLDDLKTLPGADLVGYMPRRVDLDIEWDNDAEIILAEMEFLPTDSPQDRALKIQVIEIYNSRLDEREKRKQFLVDRNLLDYKKNQIAEQQLPADERDLVHRMRLFARFHTASEHEVFIQNLLKAKQMRKEIAKLQMYRRIGLRSMSEVERWELDMKHRALLSTIDSTTNKIATQTFGPVSRLNSNASDSTLAKMDSTISGVRSESYKDKNVVDLWKSSSSKSYRTTDRGDRVVRQDSKTIDILTSNDEFKPSSLSSEVGETTLDNHNLLSIHGSTTMDIAANSEAAKVSTETSELHQSDGVKDVEYSPVDVGEVVSKPVENAPIVEHQSILPTNPKEDSGNMTYNDALCNDNNQEAKDPLSMLLSSKEIDLCNRLSIAPSHYIQVKTLLIRESFNQSCYLPNADSSGNKNPIVKIDIHKYGNIVDFCLHNGWIQR